jgi:thymidylate synthase ThyX
MSSVKILADSCNAFTEDRITTFEIKMPKCLLAELNTHRMLSRNAASSRAIPIEKVIKRIEEDPYIPRFTRNQKGMQGEVGDQTFQKECQLAWFQARENAIAEARSLIEKGAHKQNVNRLLEPWMHVPVLVTGTEWENFFKLRCDEATHPDFRSLARKMAELYAWSKPKELKLGEWHIPFGDGLAKSHRESINRFEDSLKVVTARAARISYATHDGEISFDKDINLHDMLLKEGHFSPFEHAAKAVENNTGYDGVEGYTWLREEDRVVSTYNLRGFMSYRAHIEQKIKI